MFELSNLDQAHGESIDHACIKHSHASYLCTEVVSMQWSHVLATCTVCLHVSGCVYQWKKYALSLSMQKALLYFQLVTK